MMHNQKLFYQGLIIREVSRDEGFGKLVIRVLEGSWRHMVELVVTGGGCWLRDIDDDIRKEKEN
ncbi:hypothetical protein LR48_Vigan02g056700 [Vigna angularis]|uniref:Uncharacterized protein n=1 Tax=Phaseolus angularis TaxID=3914 RepID=A0A0L9TVH3_PHAAN|nr:hypothetical protein LR48_Vigan02g056700 [Vigna angularis]